MLAHLVFLLGSLYLANAISNLATLLAVGVALLGANLGWSISMTPGLRGLARDLLLRLNARKSA